MSLFKSISVALRGWNETAYYVLWNHLTGGALGAAPPYKPTTNPPEIASKLVVDPHMKGEAK